MKVRGKTKTRVSPLPLSWRLNAAMLGFPLYAALEATFIRRETAYPADGLPLALTDTFAKDARKQQQWRAFLGKAALRKGVAELASLIEQIRAFLQPPLQALANAAAFRRYWSPQEGWSDEAE